MKKVRVVVYGNQEIAISCIRILQRSKNVELLAVIGCEDEADKKSGYPSLREFCYNNSITYYNPEKLDESFFQIVKALQPDLCFSIFYKKIFRTQFIRLPRMGIINVHAALLPRYRGPTPVIWAMRNNEKTIGVTLHYIDEGIDTGDIIGQSTIRIPKITTGFALKPIITKSGVTLFRRLLPGILKGTNKRTRQSVRAASYYGPFPSALKQIPWFLPLENIVRHVQVLSKPYDGAYGILDGNKVIIWECKRISVANVSLSGPGKIVQVCSDGSFIVSCIDGFLRIVAFEIEHVERSKYGHSIRLANRFQLA